MPDNPTTALVKATSSPALARVSSQIALTDKLLTKSEEPFLIPYRKGDKWGFCDRNKNIVIDCTYDWVSTFNDGRAIIEIKGQFGFIDKLGKLIISPIYDYACSYEEGLSAVTLEKKWGFINVLGEVVIPLIFNNACSFSEGLASVELNGKFGFVDKFGNFAIPLIYDHAEDFSRGLARVDLYNKTGFIRTDGSIHIPIKYDDISPFSEELACFQEMGKYGYMDREGIVVIEPIYDTAWPFSNGYAYTWLNNWCYTINRFGVEVDPSKDERYFSKGWHGLIEVDDGNGRYGFINTNDEIVIPAKYTMVQPREYGLIAVGIDNERTGYIDQKGVEYWED